MISPISDSELEKVDAQLGKVVTKDKKRKAGAKSCRYCDEEGVDVTSGWLSQWRVENWVPD